MTIISSLGSDGEKFESMPSGCLYLSTGLILTCLFSVAMVTDVLVCCYQEGRRGCTPLHLIIETCDVILLRQVLQFLSHDREGVRTAVNTARYDRETALHIAASQTMELHRHKVAPPSLSSYRAAS